MKNIYVMVVCLSLLISQLFVCVVSEESQAVTSASVPSPSPTTPPGNQSRWNDKDKRKVSGIFTYQILDETRKEAAIIRVNKAVKDLTIPSELDGYKIISIGQIAMDGSYIYEYDIDVSVSDLLEEKLETLTIAEGIRHIGYSAFADCKRLTTVNLPENLYCIAGSAFWECTSLKMLTIPKSSYKRAYGNGVIMMENAFAKCSVEHVIFGSQEFKSFANSYVGNLVLPRTDCRKFVLTMDKTTIRQVSVDPYVQTVSLLCEENSSGTIEKIIINGKKTKLLKWDSGLSFGTLYTIPKAKCIDWAKKYKQTYKVKSCGKMGKVTRKKQKASWKPVKTTVKMFRYNKQKKKWKTTSRKVKTYYKIYGKNRKKGDYKQIKVTTKTKYKAKYKYLKVKTVSTWE